MSEFVAKYQDQLNGVLSGFARLVFQGGTACSVPGLGWNGQE
jgi:hypothetical protein